MTKPPEVLPPPRPPESPTQAMVDTLVKTATQSAESHKPEGSRKKRTVASEKKKADEVIAQLKKGILPKGETPQTPELQEQILRTQLAEGKGITIIKSVEDIPKDPEMLNTLADILTAPAELQNDSRWLLAKGAEIREALRADMPLDQQRGARTVLKQIYQRIVDIEGVDMGNVRVRASQDPVVREKVQFIELAGNSLLPEAGVMPIPSPTGQSAVEKIYEGPRDSLKGSILEDTLQEIKVRLITDTSRDLHDTHKLPRLMTELEDVVVDYARKHGGYDSPEVQSQLPRLAEAKARIQAVINETMAAQQAAPRGRGESRLPVEEKDRNWLYDKDAQGNKILPNDYDVEIEGVKHQGSLQPLRDLLKEYEGYAYVQDQNSLYEMWKRLDDLWKDPNIAVRPGDVEPYTAKIRKSIAVARGLHFQLNQAEISQIQDKWQQRDKIFYERINNVLRSRFESSRDVMNLYSEGGVDAFIEGVQEFCGDDVAQHYEHLKKSIYFMHDLEQIARGPAGDVELLKKLVSISNTSFMREGTGDPITVAMISSYEQALRKFLHDHDGYLPPQLFEFDPITQRNAWDDEAMKFFEAKVATGKVLDIKRFGDDGPVKKEDEGKKGLGIVREDRVAFVKGRAFTLEDLKNQNLRVEAARHMAKGIGVFDNRILELFATAKAPGFETKLAKFNSIPYEGISRFFRPKGHLFGKYGMGELSHEAIFNVLFSGEDIPEWASFLKWSPEDYEGIAHAASNGSLEDWVYKKYKGILGEEKARKIAEKAKPFMEIMEDFVWTGRLGPHSQWGASDSTIGWTDLMREMEGGSVRLSRADWWADRYLEGKYSDWKDRRYSPEGKAIKEKLKHAYSTWIWAQMTLRSPQIAAENVFVASDRLGIQSADKKAFDLRKVLIKEVLQIDLDKEVTTEATPTLKQMNAMNRITILDADIAAIQYAALHGGPGGAPREITDADFDLLVGDKKDPRGGVVTQKERIDQAKLYVHRVWEEVLGSKYKTIEDWKRALGIRFGTGFIKDLKGNIIQMEDMLHIDNFEQIDQIIGNNKGKRGDVHASGGMLSQALIDREQPFFMAMDDTRLEDMDISNLGARAYARLTNDLEARKVAIGYMQELLSEFKPHFDQKKVLELLEKMYVAERGGRGPDSARAFLFYFAELFGNYYRGEKVAKLPYLGQLLRRFGEPLSVAQRIHGKHADVASINNLNQWVDGVAQIGGLPYHEVEEHGKDKGKKNKFSVQRLKRNLVAGDAEAVLEMVVIGLSIAAVTVVVAGAAKSASDESEGH